MSTRSCQWIVGVVCGVALALPALGIAATDGGTIRETVLPNGLKVLKVEVPVNIKYVAGTQAYGGTAAYSREEAMQHFCDAASVARKPFIYLSAGVTDEIFRETLVLAGEAGTDFSGVLCGRATWQDGIPVYAQHGYEALLAWLNERGVHNITLLNVLAQGAKP